MREPHYVQMCFKSVESLGALHTSLAVQKASASASTLFTVKIVELIGLYQLQLFCLALKLTKHCETTVRSVSYKLRHNLHDNTGPGICISKSQNPLNLTLQGNNQITLVGLWKKTVILTVCDMVFTMRRITVSAHIALYYCL